MEKSTQIEDLDSLEMKGGGFIDVNYWGTAKLYKLQKVRDFRGGR